MHVDTVAVTMKLDFPLDLQQFDAGVTRENREGQRSARYWLNVDDVRITYYPAADLLKLQYEMSDVSRAEAEAVLRVVCGIDVVDERVNRIDYCHDFDVADAQLYLEALRRLRVARAQAQAYSHGVVWKLRSRWIKFYVTDEGKLRYEVSNFKRAVGRMCQQWFGCERVLDELLHEGRMCYVLARSWERLGLHRASLFSSGELLLSLRAAYGSSASTAYYVLQCVEAFGSRSVALELCSRSSFYDWRKRLIDDGFVVRVDERALTVLRLPVLENLKVSAGPGVSLSLTNLREKFGVNERAKLPEWVLNDE